VIFEVFLFINYKDRLGVKADRLAALRYSSYAEPINWFHVRAG
jgi:hypothetical protein